MDGYAAAWAAALPAARARARTSFDAAAASAALDLAAEEVALTVRLWREIADLQTHVTDCASARILLLRYPSNGFASAFGYVAGALVQAHIRRRVLVLDDREAWNYAGGAACAGARTQWGCYFADTSACTADEALVEDWNLLPVLTAADGSSDGPRAIRMGPGDDSFYYHEALTALTPPSPFAALGVAWWRTQFFAALWRPMPHVVAHIEQQLRAVDAAASTDAYLSWHVRRGDKVLETKILNASSYVSGVVRLAAVSSLSRVFLASDDPAVLVSAPAQLTLGGLRVFSLLDTLRLGGSSHVSAETLSRGDGEKAHTLALEAIANIWLLSEGSALSGLMRSNFARLAADLMFAKGNPVTAFQWNGADADCTKSDCAAYYWSPRYWETRHARLRLGLPPGLFTIQNLTPS